MDRDGRAPDLHVATPSLDRCARTSGRTRVDTPPTRGSVEELKGSPFHRPFRKIGIDLYKQQVNNKQVHAFDVLGDPVRRRILDLMAEGGGDGAVSLSAGEITDAIHSEFGISQPAVSQHLKVLRDNGFATVTRAGQRRLYALDPAPLREVDEWLERYRTFWRGRLEALDTELRRGRRSSRQTSAQNSAQNSAQEHPKEQP